MSYWIARSLLLVPERVKKQLDKKQQEEAWRRRAQRCTLSMLIILALSLVSVVLTKHGFGALAAGCIVLLYFPLAYLYDQAVFSPYRMPR